MIRLPELPYAHDALEPAMSERTLRFHHDKHHAKYVETVNKLMAEGGSADTDLEDIIDLARKEDCQALLNNAGQAWNHAFFWCAMTDHSAAPSPELSSAVEAAFESWKDLRSAFLSAGTAHFGSGWIWLCAEGPRLEVLPSHDGETLAGTGKVPLLVCDLWEHAYYLDFQNDRTRYLESWWDRLPNWRLADRQWRAAPGEGAAWRYSDAFEPADA